MADGEIKKTPLYQYISGFYNGAKTNWGIHINEGYSQTTDEPNEITLNW